MAMLLSTTLIPQYLTYSGFLEGAEHWGSVITGLQSLCEVKHYSMGAIDVGEGSWYLQSIPEPLESGTVCDEA